MDQRARLNVTGGGDRPLESVDPPLAEHDIARQTAEAHPANAWRAALATSADGAGSNTGAEPGAPLNRTAGASPPPAASRKRSRRWANLLLLAGLVTAGAAAIDSGRGARVAASEAPVVAALPAFGQPSTAAAASDRLTAGATKAPIAGTAAMPQAAPRGGAGSAAEHPIAARPENTAGPQPPSFGGRFEIGDRFKIAFYERVDDLEKDKWGRTGSALQGFQQRPELSGEYAVQDDGTISVPLLGSFEAATLSPAKLQTALAGAFEKLTGRKGFVTVLGLERPPVYVLGPVKNPGSYKYVPGMTVLHAVALAGGFDQPSAEPWQRVEAVRETEKRRDAVEIMLKAVATDAVLRAERDGTAVKMPARLIQLVSEGEAKGLLAAAVERRSALVAARRNRERALSASLQAARDEVQMLSNRLQPIDGLIKLREKRVDAMRLLLEHGTINNLFMVQAQSELSDAQQRRQDAVDQYTMAQQRVALAEQELAKFQADTTNEIETEIIAADQQIAANERDFATSEGVLGALRITPVQYAESAGTSARTYEIVRQKGTAGPVALPATGMSTLQPGDLVRVVAGGEAGTADPARQPVQQVPGAAPGSAVNADGGQTAARSLGAR